MISKRFGIYVGSLSLIALLLSSCAVQPRGILDCRNVLKTAPTVRVALVTDEPGASIGVSQKQELHVDARLSPLDKPLVRFRVELTRDGKRALADLSADGAPLRPLKWVEGR